MRTVFGFLAQCCGQVFEKFQGAFSETNKPVVHLIDPPLDRVLGWLPRPLRNQFMSAQKISDELWRHLETHKKDGSQWITAEEWQGAVMELGQILCLMKDEGGMYFAPGQSLHVHFEELMQSHTIFFACLFSGFFPKTTVLPAIEEIN